MVWVSTDRPIEKVNSMSNQICLCSATFTTNISSGMILCHLKDFMLHKVLVLSDLLRVKAHHVIIVVMLGGLGAHAELG